MDDLARLVAIEEVRALKARYWRAVDRKDFALLRATFTDDACIDFRRGGPLDAPPRGTVQTPDEFVADLRQAFTDGVVSIHHGHQAEIIVQSDTEASGIWTMEDRIYILSEDGGGWLPFRRHMHGWGHYHDAYRRTPDGWRIAATTLVRSRVEAE